MTPEDTAKKIYKDSLEFENRGTATHYRKLMLKKVHESQRYLVKSYLEQIGKRRMIESARANNRGLGSV